MAKPSRDKFNWFYNDAQFRIDTHSFCGKCFIKLREIEIVIIVAGSIFFP